MVMLDRSRWIPGVDIYLGSGISFQPPFIHWKGKHLNEAQEYDTPPRAIHFTWYKNEIPTWKPPVNTDTWIGPIHTTTGDYRNHVTKMTISTLLNHEQ